MAQNIALKRNDCEQRLTLAVTGRSERRELRSGALRSLESRRSLPSACFPRHSSVPAMTYESGTGATRSPHPGFMPLALITAVAAGVVR